MICQPTMYTGNHTFTRTVELLSSQAPFKVTSFQGTRCSATLAKNRQIEVSLHNDDVRIVLFRVFKNGDASSVAINVVPVEASDEEILNLYHRTATAPLR